MIPIKAHSIPCQIYMTVLFCKRPLSICDALRNLVTFLEFKKREKYLWRSVNFCRLQPATSLKLTLLHATKSHKTSHFSKRSSAMFDRVLNTPLTKNPFSSQNQSNSFETTAYIEMFNSNGNLFPDIIWEDVAQIR